MYYTTTAALLGQFTKTFSITGGLIQLNHGKPRSLQYVVNAAFLASVFSDYLRIPLDGIAAPISTLLRFFAALQGLR